MSTKSRYTIVVDALSSATRRKDIQWECERYGRVLQVERDIRARCALVEFERSRDAEKAWEKLDGLKVDGCRWKVDWATRKDYEFFQWRWSEGRSPSPSPSRSRSQSPSGSPAGNGSRDEKADLAP